MRSLGCRARSDRGYGSCQRGSRATRGSDRQRPRALVVAGVPRTRSAPPHAGRPQRTRRGPVGHRAECAAATALAAGCGTARWTFGDGRARRAGAQRSAVSSDGGFRAFGGTLPAPKVRVGRTTPSNGGHGIDLTSDARERSGTVTDSAPGAMTGDRTRTLGDDPVRGARAGRLRVRAVLPIRMRMSHGSPGPVVGELPEEFASSGAPVLRRGGALLRASVGTPASGSSRRVPCRTAGCRRLRWIGRFLQRWASASGGLARESGSSPETAGTSLTAASARSVRFTSVSPLKRVPPGRESRGRPCSSGESDDRRVRSRASSGRLVGRSRARSAHRGSS